MTEEPNVIQRLATQIENQFKETGEKPGNIVITMSTFDELCTAAGTDPTYNPDGDYRFWGIPIIVMDPGAADGDATAIQSH